MRFMHKYFSPYIEKFEKQDKRTRIALSVAAFGILLFFGIAVTLPFRNALYQTLFPKDASQAQTTGSIEERKQLAVNAIKDPGAGGSCLDKASYALAALYNNVNTATANNYIADYYNNPTCRPPDNTSTDYDGYWSQLQMWPILLNSKAASNLTASNKNFILAMMRSWVNQRSTMPKANRSPYVIEDSENHEAVRGSGNLLALQALMDSSDPKYGPNAKLADGYTVAQHYNAWLGYWMRYFQEKAREGINVEIASPGYAKYTIAAYYNIYNHTKSQALKKQAENFLNLYWADVAQEFLSTGIRGGSETRVYRNSYAYNGPHFSLINFLCIYDWYVCTVKGDNYSLLAATGTYMPPGILRSIAIDTNKPPYSYISRRMGLEASPPTAPIIYYVKVLGGSYINRYSYITPEYVLGTQQTDSSKKYIELNNQNRLMGVFFSDNIASRIIIIGNGTYRPTSDTGSAEINGIAGPNAMIVGRDVRAAYSDGTQIFIHDGKLKDNLSVAPDEKGWLFTRNAYAFVAIRIANGGYDKVPATFLGGNPVGVQQAGGIFLNLKDKWSPVVIQLGRLSDFQKPGGASMEKSTQGGVELQTTTPMLSISPTVTALVSGQPSQPPTQSIVPSQSLVPSQYLTPSLSPSPSDQSAQQQQNAAISSSPSPAPTLTPDQAFEAFKAKVKDLPLTYAGGKLSFTSLNGDKFEYFANSPTEAKVIYADGKTSSLNPQYTYKSPYIEQLYGQSNTVVTYGDQSITINADCKQKPEDDCSAMTPIAYPPPDKTGPAVTVVSPTGGQVNDNSNRKIVVTAVDPSGVASVQTMVSGVVKCNPTTLSASNTYTCNWHVPAKDNATYRIQATAYDTKGNIGYSNVVTVHTPPPPNNKKKNKKK